MKAAEPIVGREFARTVSIRAADVDEKGRTAAVSFSSESPVRDFYGPPVVLLHEKRAADFGRFEEMGSVLVNHDVDQVVGRPERVTLDLKGRKGRAVIRFDADPESDRIFQKVKAGSIRGVSVRYLPKNARELKEKESWTSPEGRTFKGPLFVVDAWEPREISLTPLPADQAVGVGRKETAKMEPDEITTTTVPETTTPEAELETSRAEAGRVRDLTFVAQVGGMDSELARWISTGVTVEAARAEALKKRAAGNARTCPVSFFEYGEEQRTKARAALEAGLLSRLGYLRAEDPEYKGVQPEHDSLVGLARRCLREAGLPAGGTESQVIGRVLDEARRGGPVGTSSDFPYLLSSVLNKSIAIVFQEQPSTFARWCRIGQVRDLKPNSRISLSEAPDLLLNPELMPLEESAYIDQKESYTAATYGRVFSISRKAIINDDLNWFQSVASLWGAAAARLPNDLAIALLVSNPTMSDSVAMFHSTHANIGTGGAPSATTLAEAKKLMRLAKGPGGKVLNITPRVLLVPASLELACEQLLNSLIVPTTVSNAVPSFITSLELVVESRLDATSTTAWYLLAPASSMPVIEVGFLDGKRTPTVERESTGDILGLKWRSYIDIGVGQLSYQGGVYNAGA